MKTTNNITVKWILSLFVVGVIILLLYVVFIQVPKSAEDLENRISEFKLEFKGVIKSIKELDHNHALCQIMILESNDNQFNGTDYIGRSIIIKDGYATITLMRNDCLMTGDTVHVGPQDNFSIRNGVVYFDRLQNIDECYNLGRK